VVLGAARETRLSWIMRVCREFVQLRSSLVARDSCCQRENTWLVSDDGQADMFYWKDTLFARRMDGRSVARIARICRACMPVAHRPYAACTSLRCGRHVFLVSIK